MGNARARLAVIAAACATGCGLVASLGDDYVATGETPDGAVADAADGLDAAVSRDAQGGDATKPDARPPSDSGLVDTRPGVDAGTWCQQRAGLYDLCDDFETFAFSAPWDGNTNVSPPKAGPNQSAPNALAVHHDTDDQVLTKSLNVMANETVAADLWIDETTTSSNEYDLLSVTFTLNTGATMKGYLSTQNGNLTMSVCSSTNGCYSSVNVGDAKVWRHVVVSNSWDGTHLALTVSIDGVPRGPITETDTSQGTIVSTLVELGARGSGFDAFEVLYDDVTLDVR